MSFSGETYRDPNEDLVLKLSKIKNIMKEATSNAKLSNDGVVLLTAAAEQFAHFITRETDAVRRQSNRKTISYDHVAETVSKLDVLDFLEPIIPQRVNKKRKK
ncbi:hypothetical protein PCE1_001620 [Barthelona sp. PCE]